MALAIEDGTGVDGADSFITVDELDAYALDYFSHEETGSNAIQEAALRRSFLFMKSLSWKSDFVFPTFGGTIPEDVRKAQAFFAHFEKETPNGLAPSVVPGQQKILTQVGNISWTPTGQTGVDAQRAVVTMAMDLLSDYLTGSGSTRFLRRA